MLHPDTAAQALWPRRASLPADPDVTPTPLPGQPGRQPDPDVQPNPLPDPDPLPEPDPFPRPEDPPVQDPVLPTPGEIVPPIHSGPAAHPAPRP